MILGLLLSLAVDTITLPEVTVYPDFQQTVEVLARKIEKEAGNQSRYGKEAVATVIVNRADYYDKPLLDVMTERSQFAKLNSRDFKRPIDPESYEVALEVLAGNKILHPAILYFANERISTNRRWIRIIKRFAAFQIGDHTFYFDPTAQTFYSILDQRRSP